MKQILKKVVIWIIERQARLALWRYRPSVVAVTGNVGKTSAKETVYNVLSVKYHVRKSQKSFNSEIGIPLTILGCPTGWSDPLVWLRNICKGCIVPLYWPSYPQWLVLEVGADRPGDIKRVASWLHPDVAVVTAFGETPVHIEFFSSREELIAEKGELVKAVRPSGIAVLNSDDEDVLSFRTDVANKPILYGFGREASVQASHYSYEYDSRGTVTGFSFKVNRNGSSVPFSLSGFVGRQHVYAALAGISVGMSQGLNMVEIREALEAYRPQPGRMNLLSGREGSTIIDDSYNASPAATHAALTVLGELATSGRKIAILGDMMELGAYTHPAHVKVGRHALEVADMIITVGSRIAVIAELDDGMGVHRQHYSHSREALDGLSLDLREGDVVLVKGSQSARMERIVKRLLEEGQDTASILVRQEQHWGE